MVDSQLLWVRKARLKCLPIQIMELRQIEARACALGPSLLNISCSLTQILKYGVGSQEDLLEIVWWCENAVQHAGRVCSGRFAELQELRGHNINGKGVR